MRALTQIGDSTLFEIDPEATAIAWGILRRPQTMRIVPQPESEQDLRLRIHQAKANGGGAYVVLGDENQYPGGVILFEQLEVNGRPTSTLAFSFDRCVAGREWAERCLTWLNDTHPLVDRTVLIGTSMANSERLAKQLGLKTATWAS